jgi:hypothetical protein
LSAFCPLHQNARRNRWTPCVVHQVILEDIGHRRSRRHVEGIADGLPSAGGRPRFRRQDTEFYRPWGNNGL